MNIEVTGQIIDDDSGAPIQEAEVEIFYRRYWRRYSSRWRRLQGVKTDANGSFTVRLEEDAPYLIIVSHKDKDVKRHDYVPYGLHYTPNEENSDLSIEMKKSAYVIVKGQAYFIETTAIPSSIFRVIDKESGEQMRSGSMILSYGSLQESFSGYLSLPGDVVIVPAGESFTLQTLSNVQVQGKVTQKELVLDGFSEDGLEPGEVIEVDLRSQVLPSSIIDTRNATDQVKALLLEKESEGFFLAVERQQLSQVITITDEAETILDLGDYEKSFTRLREAYVVLSDLRVGLTSLVADAARSVYILVGFVAISSVIVAFLMFEDNLWKLAASSLVYLIFLYTLHELHPGSSIITQMDYIRVSIASFVTVNIGAYSLPRFLSDGGGDKVPLRNMIVPILSVAKRSLRRRWLRFALTLTSVLMLVASFISLTSFTSGYGMSFTMDSQLDTLTQGILIRTPNPPPMTATAPFCGGDGTSGPLPIDESLIGWFNETEGPMILDARIQNQPMRQYREAYRQFATLNGTHLFGVLAVNPEKDAKLTDLDEAVSVGRYLETQETNTALISMELANRLELTVGESVIFETQGQTFRYEVVGLLDDDKLASVLDIDGAPLLPDKIIEVIRVEYDGPDWVIEGLAPCDPDEVIVINQRTAASVSNLWINRLVMTFSPEVDLKELATKLALTRGFRVWASTSDGIYLAQLTDYFEGKGLPIVIPWVIVVLNVVVTMLNSYYERRHEVMIYSSIGMNPRHISSIFLAEAAVIGVIGGSVGYMMGLGAYKFIYLVTPALQVKQKVSAFWSVAALVISLAAVLVGGLVALKNSTSITPSLRRRWKAEASYSSDEPFRIEIPVHIFEEEIDEYVEFINDKLQSALGRTPLETRMIKMNEIETDGERSWIFKFIFGTESQSISGIYTRNTLTIARADGSTYHTVLTSVTSEDGAQSVGRFLRKISLDWSLNRSEGQRRVENTLINTEGDQLK
ncbi:MAG: FtsX-like permease family protein [Candidatus Bathyarchaeota archaeon]|nr:FtsX-like permease family protein [Candidatus Bathyarchaeota archaeon]